MEITDLRVLVLRYLARNGCGNACQIACSPDILGLVDPEDVLVVLEDLREGSTLRFTLDPKDHREYAPIQRPYELA